MTLKEKVETIRSLPFFSHLSNQEINFLAKKTETKELALGKLIVTQEDSCTNAFFILKGGVKVYRILEDGKIVHISVLGPGEIIGELSLIDGLPRSASVEAIQKTTLLEIKKKDFDKFLTHYPKVALDLLKIVSLRLRLVHLHLEKITQGTLIERTKATLKNLSLLFPNKEINLSHEQLAQIVGATRARITEVLDHLAKTKEVILSRKKIILLE